MPNVKVQVVLLQVGMFYGYIVMLLDYLAIVVDNSDSPSIVEQSTARH